MRGEDGHAPAGNIRSCTCAEGRCRAALKAMRDAGANPAGEIMTAVKTAANFDDHLLLLLPRFIPVRRPSAFGRRVSYHKETTRTKTTSKSQHQPADAVEHLIVEAINLWLQSLDPAEEAERFKQRKRSRPRMLADLTQGESMKLSCREVLVDIIDRELGRVGDTTGDIEAIEEITPDVLAVLSRWSARNVPQR
jgi:hypothetical protein